MAIVTWSGFVVSAALAIGISLQICCVAPNYFWQALAQILVICAFLGYRYIKLVRRVWVGDPRWRRMNRSLLLFWTAILGVTGLISLLPDPNRDALAGQRTAIGLGLFAVPIVAHLIFGHWAREKP